MSVVLLILILAVYWQVGGHAFVSLDDPAYVYENPRVKEGLTRDGFTWAITATYASNWHPLTWLSHMLDVSLFGLDTGKHHLVNVLFHLLNTFLLFHVLRRMTGKPWESGLAAAIFAVHPLHVESVAWVSERKDVLSAFFFLLTLWAYTRYCKRPGLIRYLPVFVFFALGLMSKPMLVTLPFVLLLLDFWPLGRAKSSELTVMARRILEKIPLLALSAISCILTYRVQAKGVSAVSSLDLLPLRTRLANAVVSYVTYLWKMVWPGNLAVFYPHPGFIHGHIPGWTIAGSALLLGGLSLLSLWQARCRPWLVVGWLWYLGTLVPVIGLVQVGSQAMADRYTYLPMIGVCLMIAWGLPEALKSWHFRQVALGVIAGTAILAFTVAAQLQAGYWQNNFTLFTHALRVTEKNWMAWYNLGAAYGKLGRYPQAVEAFREALLINPGYAEAWSDLGAAYGILGQSSRSIEAYREVLRRRPDDAPVWKSLAITYGNLGMHTQAIDAFRDALRIDPGHAESWSNLGVSYASIGRYPQAIEAYREALRLKPDYANAWYNLGLTYSVTGQGKEVVEVFRQLRRIDPGKAEVFSKEVGLSE